MIFSHVFHLWGALAYRDEIRNMKNIILIKFNSVNQFSKNRETHCVLESHELQQLRNEIKGNLNVEPTCIDHIE